MQAVPCFPGARVIDSYPFSVQDVTTPQTISMYARKCADLKRTGVDGFVGYLGAMNVTRLNAILAAGLAFIPVTKAGEYKDGAEDEVAQLQALGIPQGTTVFCDMEGLDAWNTPIAQLKAMIESWAARITSAGYIAGLYVGAPQPFTGSQLYELSGITAYWLGQGRCVSKPGNPTAADPSRDAYPDCGYVMRQDWHNNPDADKGVKGGMLWKDTGVIVDTNSTQADHKGRLVHWVVQ